MSTDPRDIVDVLRSRADVVANRRRALLSEAADEIVRLRAAAAALHELLLARDACGSPADDNDESSWRQRFNRFHAALIAARAASDALKEPQ